MPSGYTQKIVEGEQSFEEFFYTAVRAMGSFVHMRDYDLGAPLRLPEDDFVTKGSEQDVAKRLADVRRYERELRDELAKTHEEIEAEFERDKAKQWAEYKETYARRLPIYERVQRLRAQVADWVPPTPEHEGFKKFMLQQLDETTKWDAELPKEPTFPDTAAEYHAQEVKYLEDRVKLYRKWLQEEIDSPDVQQSRIDWIKDLIKSVPPPAGSFKDGELDKIR